MSQIPARISVDIPDVYRRHPVAGFNDNGTNQIPMTFSRIHRLYRSGILPLHFRCRLRTYLRRTLNDMTWFREFQGYWSRIIGARPIWDIYDFHYMLGMLRDRFQDLEVDNMASPDGHLAAWQMPEQAYLLFHYARKEAAQDYYHYIGRARRHHPGFRSTLEYGASIAPITMSLREHVGDHVRSVICDVEQLAFHYGAYRFRQADNVRSVTLQPSNDFAYEGDGPFDVVFCVEVFEHLNEPLKTVSRFHELLDTRGILIFDYIKGDADGLDTLKGQEERGAVLDYVKSNFDILDGDIDNPDQIGIITARKR